jgi:hypothetical protein
VKRALFHSAARAELDEAMVFYESCAHGLGIDFALEVEKAVVRIQRSPDSWPPHKRSGFRKCFVHRFPFTIFYVDLPEHIWVVAIAHTSRRPDYWSRRHP